MSPVPEPPATSPATSLGTDPATGSTSPVTTPGDAHRLVAAALKMYADHHAGRLGTATYADDRATARDVALADTMASLGGWIHTTRLREFLASEAIVRLVDDLAAELLRIAEDSL